MPKNTIPVFLVTALVQTCFNQGLPLPQFGMLPHQMLGGFLSRGNHLRSKQCVGNHSVGNARALSNSARSLHGGCPKPIDLLTFGFPDLAPFGLWVCHSGGCPFWAWLQKQTHRRDSRWCTGNGIYQGKAKLRNTT